eukprot:10768052-Lingulodinium_polyedra.AAC.1
MRSNQILMNEKQLTDIRNLGEPDNEICLIMMTYYDRAQWGFKTDDRLARAMAYDLGLRPTE